MPPVDVVNVELRLLAPAPAALRAVLRERPGRLELRGVTLGAASARFRTPAGAFGRSEEVAVSVRAVDGGCVVRLESGGGEGVRRELVAFANRVAQRMGQPGVSEPATVSATGEDGCDPTTVGVASP